MPEQFPGPKPAAPHLARIETLIDLLARAGTQGAAVLAKEQDAAVVALRRRIAALDADLDVTRPIFDREAQMRAQLERNIDPLRERLRALAVAELERTHPNARLEAFIETDGDPTG
ncbi:MAG: hypothetical protein ACU0BF_02350 [Paracoccaceae bacterium]